MGGSGLDRSGLEGWFGLDIVAMLTCGCYRVCWLEFHKRWVYDAEIVMKER